MDNGNGGGSLVHRRILGRRLRLLREHAGMTLDEAAPQLDWSTSTLSRIENGQQAPHVHGVRSMMDLYGLRRRRRGAGVGSGQRRPGR